MHTFQIFIFCNLLGVLANRGRPAGIIIFKQCLERTRALAPLVPSFMFSPYRAMDMHCQY